MEKVDKLFIEELESRVATSPMIVTTMALGEEEPSGPTPAWPAYLNANYHAPFQLVATTLAIGEELPL